jgi:hypothetical protein
MADKKESNNKWWEFYFVRYFVGTVVGGTILLYLNARATWAGDDGFLPGISDASDLDANKLALLAALGLTYCYVASAPILVLHATRGAMSAFSSRILPTAILILVVLTAAAATTAETIPGAALWVMMVLFAVMLVFQLCTLGIAILDKGGSLHAFYARLVAARAKPDEGGYVESYRHLREHGNAFFIVLFEFILGLVLTAAPSGQLALLILFLWIVPAAFVWLVGTALEDRFAQ